MWHLQAEGRGAETGSSGQVVGSDMSRVPKEVTDLAKQPAEEEYSGENSGSAKALRPEPACGGWGATEASVGGVGV